ncbi:hypothetical protein K523DRAFT_221810, partial [Schizophyllum commune Tattone D]
RAAMSRPDAEMWKGAIQDELSSLSLESMGTFGELINESDLPPRRKPITSKLVFKTKYDANGKVQRYK